MMIQINPKTPQAYKLLHDGSLALARAEGQGIRVDMVYAEKKKQHLTRKIEHLEIQFRNTKFFRHWEHTVKSKVNINSNQQLANFLYGTKKLEPAHLTTSGMGSTDEEALLQLNIPELNDLLEIRKLKKVKDTYLDGFMREQVNGYVHPSFNLHIPVTFRSSSSRPNLQNVPIRDEEAMQTVRGALYPRPGHQLLEVDYSGLEVKIIACYSQDSNLLKYTRDPTSDIHGDMAKQLFLLDKFDKSEPSHKILRSAAKNGFIFPEFYGDYYKNCAAGLVSWGKLFQGKWKTGQGIKMPEDHLADHLISKGIKSYKQFEDHVKDIEDDFKNNRFPDHIHWEKRWWETYQKYGYIDLKTGFRCSGVMNRKHIVNYPVQGAAFHCLLWAFIELDRIMQKEKWKSKLIGQVHDSIIFDIFPDELHEVARIIKRVTCEDLPAAWDWIIVPLSIDADICPVDGSWADKKSFVLN